MKEDINICRDFNYELGEIADKLKQLKEGRIYERTNVRMDGTLNTNVVQLEKMLIDLFLKIEGSRLSTKEEFAKYFGLSEQAGE